MALALRDNAREFVRVAGLEGLGIAYGEALRALYRHRGDFGRALDFVRQRVFRNNRERSRLERNIFPLERTSGITGMKRSRADSNIAVRGVLHGANITLGQEIAYTKDRLNCSIGKRTRRYYDLTRSGQYLWQKMANYASPAGSLINRAIALDLDVGTNNTTKLPAYAFNLTAIAHLGRASSVLPQFYNIPMYRLQKSTDLAPNTQQYTWVRSSCYRADGTIDAEGLWQLKFLRGEHNACDSYCLDWSNIGLLFHCGQGHDCTIHTDIVRFKNRCGPIRQYYKTGDASTTINDFDPALTTKEAQSADVFWESFWAHRVVHPLAEYTNFDKEKNIKFLSKGTITLNGPLGDDARHHRSIFVRDGYVRSNQADGFDDYTGGTGAAQTAIQAPLDGTHAANVSATTNPGNTNTQLTFQNFQQYQDDPEKDVWLFIYADMLPARGTSQVPCSFDMHVRSQYKWKTSGVHSVQPIPTANPA